METAEDIIHVESINAHLDTPVDVFEALDDNESCSDSSEEDNQGRDQEEEYFEVKSVKYWVNLDGEIFPLFAGKSEQSKLGHLIPNFFTFSHHSYNIKIITPTFTII